MGTAQSLKDIGLKATLPRRRILELFEASKVRHLSAEDVYKALLAEGLDVGLATVYRVPTQSNRPGSLRASISRPARRCSSSTRAAITTTSCACSAAGSRSFTTRR